MADPKHFFLSSSRPCIDRGWRPSVDVYRTRNGWFVKCDLAGVRRHETQVSASGCRLTIAGVRRDLSITEGHRAYSMEIAYNRFERTVELPCNLDEASIHVDYSEGMLLITISGC